MGIKEERIKKGYSQKELASVLDVSQAYLSAVESGKKNITKKMSAMLSELGFVLDDSLEPEEETFSIPILDVRAAAGSGIVNETELVVATAQISVLFQSEFGKASVIKVSGDSMEPTLSKDQWVLVNKTQHIRTDGIFVFLHDNELRCKRIQKDSHGGIYIISDNPKYKEEYYPAGSDHLGEMLLVGEVVGTLKKM